jgi:hypothetical protein
VDVNAKYDAVITDYGYVLKNENGGWSARLKVGEPPAVLGVDQDD